MVMNFGCTHETKMAWEVDKVTSYEDRMFCVSIKGFIMSLNIDRSSKHIKIKEILPELFFPSMILISSHFVISTDRHLLLVHRLLNKPEEHYEEPYKLLVYKLMMNSNRELIKCIPMPDLGGDSLFLADKTHSVSVLASMYPGYCKPNLFYKTFGNQIQIFNLDDEIFDIERFNSNKDLATWIVPSMKM